MRTFSWTFSSSLRGSRILTASILGAMLIAIATSSFAFDIGKLIANDPAPPDKFRIIRVADLEAMIANKSSQVNIYDANGWGLRSRVGIIPGAHLLTSEDKYDVTTTLPPNKDANLVFYCADTL
jgi:hypothetical protein